MYNNHHLELVRHPLVTGMEPEFGPQAGGTNITLVGTDFIDPVETVYLGRDGNHDYSCLVTASYVGFTLLFLVSICRSTLWVLFV